MFLLHRSLGRPNMSSCQPRSSKTGWSLWRELELKEESDSHIFPRPQDGHPTSAPHTENPSDKQMTAQDLPDLIHVASTVVILQLQTWHKWPQQPQTWHMWLQQPQTWYMWPQQPKTWHMWPPYGEGDLVNILTVEGVPKLRSGHWVTRWPDWIWEFLLSLPWSEAVAVARTGFPGARPWQRQVS